MPIRATLLVLLCAALLAAPALAQAPPAGENIQLTIGVAVERDGKPEQAKTFSLVCRAGDAAKLVVGNRVPIPATTFNTGPEKESTPVTSFSYQNVGFIAGMKCDRLKDGRIAVQGSCEDSSLRGPAPGAPGQPIVTTFSQELNVVLVPGKPLTVARFSDLKGVTTSLTIEARPLD
jgi:hypothetical protein